MIRLSLFRCFLFLTLLAAAFAACRVDPDEDPVVIVTTDPEFSIDLFEQRDAADGTPTFGLWVESVKKYDCAGYGIDASVSVQNNNIRVTLLGVTTPSPCTGAPAPAKQFLAIGNLPDGTYGFILSLRDAIVNEGVLTISGGHFSLSLPDQQGIDFQNLVMEHIPDGLVWGYAAIPDEPSEPVADDFIFNLKTITTEAGLSPGYYSYFTISGAGNLMLHKRIEADTVSEQFVRRLNAAPDALQSLLTDYRSSTQQPLQIRCWTTFGEL